MQCCAGGLAEAALPSQHTSSNLAAEPLSADASTAAFEMATVTFSGLLTKAWMKSTISCSSLYMGNCLIPNKGGEQGGL